MVRLWGFLPPGGSWGQERGTHSRGLGACQEVGETKRPRRGKWRLGRFGWGCRRLGAQGQVPPGPTASRSLTLRREWS